jgi:hypothetical protein
MTGGKIREVGRDLQVYSDLCQCPYADTVRTGKRSTN